MDMVSAFRGFLEKENFLPFTPENKNWNNFQITHPSKKPNKDKIKFERERIKMFLGGKQGIYLYLNNENNLLYVGKSVNLYSRVYSHYRESFLGKGVWSHFFSENTGELTILWREISTDRQRRALEEMIEEVQRTKFDKKFPRGKRHLPMAST